MNYYIATIITKGKKEEVGLYANDKKQANELAKIKLSGIIIKIREGEEPLDMRFQRFKANF